MIKKSVLSMDHLTWRPRHVKILAATIKKCASYIRHTINVDIVLKFKKMVAMVRSAKDQ